MICSFHPSLLFVFLAAAPQLKQMTVPTRVDEGSKLTVKCEATGNPLPTYRWFKDGNELKKSKKVRIKNGQKNSRVQINRARVEDSGNYTCVVENLLGKDNSTGTVHVQSSEYGDGEGAVLLSLYTPATVGPLTGGTAPSMWR
ncbi:Pro-neuregulin-2, membrane-bound isoform [Takifugu flavidus]|uniref:Pro-neuregulin-2, membrane-bound isoform n=1 Tax=Takifugu flavidus TaxID=433684 RepID=A0A5C6P4N3_9TELE|nr:Pro-neuregulin-2, membrane-bound isoform [Takifugu flavidus]